MAAISPIDARSIAQLSGLPALITPVSQHGSMGAFLLSKPVAGNGPDKAPHIALIGNYLPQKCGLATFTTDTRKAFVDYNRAARVDTYIMYDADGTAYPEEVTHLVRRDRRSDYRLAGQRISKSGATIAFVQHEFGIFGGRDGEYILDLVENLEVPLAVTLHTVVDNPSAGQSRIMRRLIASAKLLIVMAEHGRDILREHYNVADEKIAVVPHGIPDFAYRHPDLAKPQFGLEGRKTVLTFGLLSHDKGIDRMIEAMPAIIRDHSDAIYVILGATHPNLVAREGEALRNRLLARASELGVAEHVNWVDAFVELGDLVDYLQAADVYVTPYLNPMQITSGTLAYAVGMGKPVVSTPYIHASELLVRGNGVLVPFDDSKALAAAISSLLKDDVRRNAMARTAYARGREMVWDKYAEVLLRHFADIANKSAQDLTFALPSASAA